ncbi:MAG TPA: DivIVA domain-containing protein, partial [Ilumatobacteraceae bacterium]
MELSPQSVSSTTFKIVKKGYDPDEVRAYLTQLAGSIETTQSQAAAMEARARAAVARLQEIAAQPAAAAPAAAVATPAATDEAETISRTLLLAQRTADATVAEANEQARQATETANAEARTIVAGAREMANRMVDDGKAEARRAGESQRVQVESEVQALLARREFLLSDVDHLEQHLVMQRDRLREVAGALTDLSERVPGGLGDVRRPLISAVADESPRAAAEVDASPSIDAGAGLDETEAMPRIDADTLQHTDPAPAEDAPMHVDSDSTPAAASMLDPIWSERSSGRTGTSAAD